jgi:hypothetical protein
MKTALIALILGCFTSMASAQWFLDISTNQWISDGQPGGPKPITKKAAVVTPAQEDAYWSALERWINQGANGLPPKAPSKELQDLTTQAFHNLQSPSRAMAPIGGPDDSGRQSAAVQAPATQQYNPYADRWETVRAGETLQLNQMTGSHEFARPGESPMYNPYNGKFEFPR